MSWSFVKSKLTVGSDEQDTPSDLDDLNRQLYRERPPSLSGIVDDVLERSIEKREFFRPSMINGCNRANVWHYKQMAPHHPSRQGPRMLRILDNGSAVHEVVQRYLGDHPDWFFAKESRVLRKVAGAWIRGSCDGVMIRRSDGYRFGIEIKTKAHVPFGKLTAPEDNHVNQASLYARLQDLHWIVILYWDKNNHDLKEFPVQFDPKRWRAMKNRIRYLKKFVDEGELPEFDIASCDPTFCSYVDFCKSKGGKPHLVPEKPWLR